MSGFAPEWLALREDADHRAVNHAVRHELLAYINGRNSIRIADLGCGTGSNFRSLAPEISARQSWLLVDHDPRLLQLAAAMTADIAKAQAIEVRVHEADLSGGEMGEIARAADLVTAAALFDLISPEVIETMVAAIVEAGAAFYTVLTYDGLAAWLPEDTINTTMRTAFNAHQRRDKGFGAAAGPDATDVLAAAFAAHGYRVLRGKSPWILDDELTTLRQEADRGWAGAVVEMGALSQAQADTWLAARKADDAAVTVVGHDDLLAVPMA